MVKRYDIGYKRRYEVYGHYRNNKSKSYSEYIFDTCLVYAREQFKTKYPNIVIDIIRHAPY